MRHLAQLLLDRLDRLPRRCIASHCWREAQRISAGEPADRAGQVDVVKQGFAAVPFQLDQRRWLPAPAADHLRQRRQQQVVDLSAVCAGCLLQQLSGTFGIQPHADGLRMTILLATLRVVARQLRQRTAKLTLPYVQLFT